MSKPGDSRYHVVPDMRGGWSVRREGSSRVSSTHQTQDEARDRACRNARSGGGDVYIHRPNGEIRERNSYGNDPTPPRSSPRT